MNGNYRNLAPGHRKGCETFLLTWWRACVPFAVWTSLLIAQTPSVKTIRHKINLVGGLEITAADRAGDLAAPRDRFPQVHFSNSKDFFNANKYLSKTPSGLYVLDANFIPAQLPDILAKAHFTLHADGSLANAQGSKISMVLWHKLVQVTTANATLPEHSRWTLFPTALAAHPYALKYVSAWGNWYADTGSCGSLKATTGADAWGPLQKGSRAHTAIQYIETRAWPVADRSFKSNCQECGEYAATSESSDSGCLWPVSGKDGDGYADLKDGDFSWSWSW